MITIINSGNIHLVYNASRRNALVLYLIVTLIMVCLAADLSPSQLGGRIHSDSQIKIIPAGVLAQFFLDHGL